MKLKNYYFYILTNKFNTVLYCGITNNLKRRTYEHKNKLSLGFTNKYNINKLVYYEIYEDPITAISREKKIKGSSRLRKMDLINSFNPEWNDLYESI